MAIFSDIPDLASEDFGQRFAVDAAVMYEGHEWAESYFTSNLESAKKIADRLSIRYGCVRLYEKGKWLNNAENFQVGWVAFWWSDSTYVGFTPYGRGHGIPEGKKKAIDYDAWPPEQ